MVRISAVVASRNTVTASSTVEANLKPSVTSQQFISDLQTGEGNQAIKQAPRYPLSHVRYANFGEILGQNSTVTALGARQWSDGCKQLPD